MLREISENQMKPISSDTSPEAQRMLFELLRNARPSKKLELTFGLIQGLRELIFANIRQEFPEATEEELQRKLIARLLPRESVILGYGFDPHQPTND
jgi:hypothetical protein